MPKTLTERLDAARGSLGRGLGDVARRGPPAVAFWLVALGIGIAAGLALLLFRMGIERLQARIYGTDDILTLHSFAAGLDWYWVLLAPVAGGLAVGLLLHGFTDGGRGCAAGAAGGAVPGGRAAGVQPRAGGDGSGGAFLRRAGPTPGPAPAVPRGARVRRYRDRGRSSRAPTVRRRSAAPAVSWR